MSIIKMPPKKKPTRQKQRQTQRQTVKQTVNIKIGDTKRKTQRKTTAATSSTQQVQPTNEWQRLAFTALLSRPSVPIMPSTSEQTQMIASAMSANQNTLMGLQQQLQALRTGIVAPPAPNITVNPTFSQTAPAPIPAPAPPAPPAPIPAPPAPPMPAPPMPAPKDDKPKVPAFSGSGLDFSELVRKADERKKGRVLNLDDTGSILLPDKEDQEEEENILKEVEQASGSPSVARARRKGKTLTLDPIYIITEDRIETKQTPKGEEQYVNLPELGFKRPLKVGSRTWQQLEKDGKISYVGKGKGKA